MLRIIARMNVGGPAQQLTGLLEGLDQERFEQVLAIGDVDDGEEDWFALRRPDLGVDPRIVRIADLGRPLSPRRDRSAYRQLRRLIHSYQPDIVHTHTAKAGLVGRAAAIRERVPTIIHTFHGHVLKGYFNPVTTRAVVLVERWLARRTNVLLSVGERVRDELLAAGVGSPERYVVIPPGVTPPARWSRSDARASLGVPDDACVVVFVGRLAGVKRPDRLIEVAESVAHQRSGVIFLVAGGASTAHLDELRLGVHLADVRFLGWITDVGKLYATADVVLLTSDNEGMPVTLIEAGMSGRTSVATDVGSVREVIEDGVSGLVVDRDHEALAAAVLRLLDEPEARESFEVAAEERMQREFSMEALVDRTQSVYCRNLAPP